VYYGEASPQLGLQLYKLGKLQLYLQQLADAQTSLERASHILALTHGPVSGELHGALNCLTQCQEERRVALEKSA